MQEPDSDEELATRQSALHAEATALLDELAQSRVFDDIGPMAVTGSYVSHLMCWRDLDVMLLVGADYRPRDVLKLMVGFDYQDERVHRSPTGEVLAVVIPAVLMKRTVWAAQLREAYPRCHPSQPRLPLFPTRTRLAQGLLRAVDHSRYLHG